MLRPLPGAAGSRCRVQNAGRLTAARLAAAPLRNSP